MTFTVCSPWATLEEARECPQGFPADMLEEPAEPPGEDDPPTLAMQLIEAASTLLNRLAGGQYPGVCSDTVRPCGGWQGQMVAYSDGGGARPIGQCTCGLDRWHDSGCRCMHRGILLPEAPVRSITEVLVDGTALDTTAYGLVDRRWLILRGDRSWPCWQDLALPTTEPRTWSITYEYGQAPDLAGRNAAIALGAQLALACIGSDDCALPTRTQQLVHEGETITLLDPFDMLDKGRTGIYGIDFWLRTVNPHGLDRDATVLNPDLLNLHRTT